MLSKHNINSLQQCLNINFSRALRPGQLQNPNTIQALCFVRFLHPLEKHLESWNGNVKDSTALPTEAHLLTGCSCLQTIWFLHSLPGLTSSYSVLFVVFTGTGSIAKPQTLVAVPTSYGRSWFPHCPDQQRTTEHHLSSPPLPPALTPGTPKGKCIIGNYIPEPDFKHLWCSQWLCRLLFNSCLFLSHDST